ncbi:hypothetical protein [uncultured Bacteroides sp.]|uniref:hypothetical protein n=1 Tax=uncultured Bacteroides sp. TaxID=162156 RepID=UPI0025FF2534|nr:hypothetical protein [uncultured Bacteroides sp.]
MRIKRIYRYFTRTASLLLGCMLAFAACVNEEDALSPDERGQEMVGLSMNMAYRSGTVGSDSEIKKVRIIAFDSRNGGLVYNQKIDNPTDNPVVIQMMSGQRDFYVITNEPASQTTTLNGVQTLADLQAVRIPWNEVEQGTTFVTFGTLPDQTIKPKEQNNITIENYRLAVKIELTLNGENFTPAQEVSFKDLPDAIPLFDVPYDCAVDNRKTKTVTPLTDPGVVSSGYVWTRTATVVLPSYIFNPATDVNKAVKISVPIGSGEISKPIGHKVSGNDYVLHRNTIYSLTANVGPDSLMIDASVRNWDENTANYPAGGGSFWNAQPQDIRVGLNGTAVFTAGLNSSGTTANFKWYCKKQLADFSFETTEITTGITAPETNKSQLTIVATSLDDACEVYCVATVTAPDGKTDRLESERATLMVVGNWVQPAGTYPSMENWKAPMNVPLGSTCLLQDDRKDENKVYRVKLMADGNWWMIQDLAYGKASGEGQFYANCDDREPIGFIGQELYGVCMESNLPTGGYLYNTFAAIQLPQGTAEDIKNNTSLAKEYLPSLCPDGWHLPGNKDGKYNEEWSILLKSTSFTGRNSADFEQFSYNNATHLNAYNKIETYDAEFNPVMAIAFMGGYIGGRYQNKPLFCSLGFAAVEYMCPITTLGDAFGNDVAAPIRCLRNFK